MFVFHAVIFIYGSVLQLAQGAAWCSGLLGRRRVSLPNLSWSWGAVSEP